MLDMDNSDLIPSPEWEDGSEAPEQTARSIPNTILSSVILIRIRIVILSAYNP